jgi:hypothetical protein
VVHYRPRQLALSTEHPMHCGWDPHALLKEADVVLVVDCDVPWIPKEGKPKPGAKVIHVGPDPLFARYPLRGFRTDLALTGAVAPTLQSLWRAAQKHAVSVKAVEERRQAVAKVSADIRNRARAGVEPAPAAITGKWLSACMNRLLDANTVLVNEYPTGLEEMVIKEPGHYFGAYAGPESGARGNGRPWVESSWLFCVEPIAGGRCRLVSRYRCATSDDFATRLQFGPLLIEPVGFAMDRRMLSAIPATGPDALTTHAGENHVCTSFRKLSLVCAAGT